MGVGRAVACSKEIVQLEVDVFVGTRSPPAGKRGPIVASAIEGVFLQDVKILTLRRDVQAQVDQDDICGLKPMLNDIADKKGVTFMAISNEKNYTALVRLATALQTGETLPVARVFLRSLDGDGGFAIALQTALSVELTNVKLELEKVKYQTYVVSLVGNSAKKLNF
jgi:hypothetical protein